MIFFSQKEVQGKENRENHMTLFKNQESFFYPGIGTMIRLFLRRTLLPKVFLLNNLIPEYLPDLLTLDAALFFLA